METLNPCPFCRSTKVKLTSHTPYLDPTYHYVICNKCHASGPSFVEDYNFKGDAEHMAVKAWNSYGGYRDGNT